MSILPLPFLRRQAPELTGGSINLRMPDLSDYKEWSSLRRDSRAFLEPWEPRWAPDELDRIAWRQRINRYRQEYADGIGVAFFIFNNRSGRLNGGITLGNIRHGVSQSAHIGYWMGERYAGQGIMGEAVRLVTGFAFDHMRLHRIEAACIPNNQRSQRVLEKAGFSREGLLRSYLRINGAWQDHLLYALLSDDRRPAPKKG